MLLLMIHGKKSEGFAHAKIAHARLELRSSPSFIRSESVAEITGKTPSID